MIENWSLPCAMVLLPVSVGTQQEALKTGTFNTMQSQATGLLGSVWRKRRGIDRIDMETKIKNALS